VDLATVDSPPEQRSLAPCDQPQFAIGRRHRGVALGRHRRTLRVRVEETQNFEPAFPTGIAIGSYQGRRVNLKGRERVNGNVSRMVDPRDAIASSEKNAAFFVGRTG
jgi:hypothetical protein